MKKLLFIVLIVLNLQISLFGIILGGTNLGILGYESYNCIKPIKPYKLYSFSNQREIDSYNSDIINYNMELKEYLDCLQEYIDNSNNDIRRIKEKINEATDEIDYCR